MREPVTWRVVVGWKRRRRWIRSLRWGTVTTGKTETRDASSIPVKHDCSRGGTGEWETIPSGGHSRVRNQEDHQCGHNREGRWEGVQRSQGARWSRWEHRGSQGRPPEEGHKGRERGPVCRKGSGHRKNGLTEPGTRSVNALTATRHTEGRCHGLRATTDHALACRSLHMGECSTGAESGRSPKRKGAERCRRGRSLIGKIRAPNR